MKNYHSIHVYQGEEASIKNLRLDLRVPNLKGLDVEVGFFRMTKSSFISCFLPHKLKLICTSLLPVDIDLYKAPYFILSRFDDDCSIRTLFFALRMIGEDSLQNIRCFNKDRYKIEINERANNQKQVVRNLLNDGPETVARFLFTNESYFTVESVE